MYLRKDKGRKTLNDHIMNVMPAVLMANFKWSTIENSTNVEEAS